MLFISGLYLRAGISNVNMILEMFLYVNEILTQDVYIITDFRGAITVI